MLIGWVTGWGGIGFEEPRDGRFLETWNASWCDIGKGEDADGLV